MKKTPSPSYSIILRVESANRPGVFAAMAQALSEKEADVNAVDTVSVSKGRIVRDFTVNARDEAHEVALVEAVKRVGEVRVIHVTDRTFLLHHGGKIEIKSKVQVKDRGDLSMLYTPGVARVSRLISEDRSKAYRFTIKRNTILIATDGSAVLGLGDIGPYAAMPVMEGKAMLFKDFGGVDAFPIALATKDTEEIIKTIKHISPPFGGVNLEDISAPRCFEIEERLKVELDIPVVHDDQHCTAIVVLAGLMNSLKVVRKELTALRVVISGAGAAGTACAYMLLSAGVRDVIVSDRAGVIWRGRAEHMNPYKEQLSLKTNPRMIKGAFSDAVKGADVFIGLSAPGVITVEDIKSMSEDPIVFALANPEPEISPEEAAPHVRILATGRSDYPNQINNMLCFPGLFRGLLDSRARELNGEMKLEAARAIASAVDEENISEDCILPGIFDKEVVLRVARAVSETAGKTGVSHKGGH